MGNQTKTASEIANELVSRRNELSAEIKQIDAALKALGRGLPGRKAKTS